LKGIISAAIREIINSGMLTDRKKYIRKKHLIFMTKTGVWLTKYDWMLAIILILIIIYIVTKLGIS